MTTVMEASGLGKRYGRTWALRDCGFELPAGRMAGSSGRTGPARPPSSASRRGCSGRAQGPSASSARAPSRTPASSSGSASWPRTRRCIATSPPRTSSRSGASSTAGSTSRSPAAASNSWGSPPTGAPGPSPGGQRAQVALALVLGKRPELLLLDEPVASLDPLARREFLQALVASVAEDGLTVVLSSHLIADLERCCDYLIVLSESRVQVLGTVDDLLAEHTVLVGPRTEGRDLSMGSTPSSGCPPRNGRRRCSCGRTARSAIPDGPSTTSDSKSWCWRTSPSRLPARSRVHERSPRDLAGVATTSGPARCRRGRARAVEPLPARHGPVGAAHVRVQRSGGLCREARRRTDGRLRSQDEGCRDLGAALASRFFGLRLLGLVLFTLAPLLIGMFWGAPLIAREVEQGTHALWTQGVTRRRWTVAQIAAVAAMTVVVVRVRVGGDVVVRADQRGDRRAVPVVDLRPAGSGSDRIRGVRAGAGHARRRDHRQDAPCDGRRGRRIPGRPVRRRGVDPSALLGRRRAEVSRPGKHRAEPIAR